LSSHSSNAFAWLSAWMKDREISLWGAADLRDFDTPRVPRSHQVTGHPVPLVPLLKNRHLRLADLLRPITAWMEAAS